MLTKAIYNSPKDGPIFGQNDIWVSNRANERSVFSNVPSAFVGGQEYMGGEMEVRGRFVGSEKGKEYRVKEWEVWGVGFGGEEEGGIEQGREE